MLTRIGRTVARRWRTRVELARYGAWRPEYAQELSFTGAVERYADCNALYAYMHHFLHHSCPPRVREHRAYFSQAGRGFGEDALHAMWWLLLSEFRPRHCLEIGVYRGQVISLWALVAQELGLNCQVHGISPFAPVGDTVSQYRDDVDYLRDTLSAFARFGLREPVLVRALSTEPAALAHLRQQTWDLIYIDGSHEYDIVLSDYQACRDQLAPGGLLVLDDASLQTAFRPPSFSFAGHEGPSRVARQFAKRELTFLGAVGHNNVFQQPRADRP